MSMMFRPATVDARKPLIGLYGLSGGGKTYSALLLARGLVGPAGKIKMIDTESGRGSFFADKVPGGYDVLQLGEPFSTERYMEAIALALQAPIDALIIDSCSHEWEGVGGVTDKAMAIERATDKPGLHCWKEPKMVHARMMFRLLQAPVPVIICLRGKRKSKQMKVPIEGKAGRFKTQIVKDEHPTPLQDSDFIFEMTVHAEVMLAPGKDEPGPNQRGGWLRVTKVGHPDLEQVFVTGERVSIETGERLAAWCKGAEPPARRPTVSSGPAAATVAPKTTQAPPATSAPPSGQGVSPGDPVAITFPRDPHAPKEQWRDYLKAARGQLLKLKTHAEVNDWLTLNDKGLEALLAAFPDLDQWFAGEIDKHRQSLPPPPEPVNEQEPPL